MFVNLLASLQWHSVTLLDSFLRFLIRLIHSFKPPRRQEEHAVRMICKYTKSRRKTEFCWESHFRCYLNLFECGQCWLDVRMAWQFLLATTFWDVPTCDLTIWTCPLPGNAGGQSVVLTVRRLALGNTVKARCDEQDHGKTKWQMKTTSSTDLIMRAVLLLLRGGQGKDRKRTRREVNTM